VLLVAVIGGAGWVATRHLLADYHLRAGREALRQRRLAQARSHFERSVSYRPGSIDAHLLAARAARLAGQFGEARQYLDRCRQLQKGESEETQLEEYMLRAQQGDVEKVLSLLWAYVEKNKPQAPLVLEALCLGCLLNSRIPQARVCLHRWQDLAPDDPQAYYCEGLYHQRYGELMPAKDCFTRALELDPDRADARLRLAQVQLGMSREKEAAELFAALLRQDPGQKEAVVGLARCYRGLGRLQEARRLLEDYLGRHEDDATAITELGCVALDEGSLPEAERLLRRGVALEPVDQLARYQFVVCLRRLGKVGEADREEQARRRLEEDFRRIEAIVLRELVSHPDDPRLSYEVATLLYRHGKKRAAAEWLYTTLKYAPDHRPSHALLAAYYREKGEADLAEQHQSRAGDLIVTSPAPF
jgi:tetratricopeptide (TPR) repeat protein